MGTVTTTSAATPSRDLSRWNVSAIMSRPAIAVPVTATMIDALRAFAASGLRHLAVVDESGRCVGLLGDRVVAAAWAQDPIGFPMVPVGLAMGGIEQPLIVAEAKVADAARLMHRCGADAVVITDAARQPIGVLTAGDLIALLAKPTKESAATDG